MNAKPGVTTRHDDGTYVPKRLRWGIPAAEAPTHSLPFSAVDLVGTLARLEARIARLEKTLDEHGIYA